MGTRKKVVIDTNVLISALGWSGSEESVVELAFKGVFDFFITHDIIEELSRVINYHKFPFSQELNEGFIASIIDGAQLVSVSRSIDVIEDDPSDNIFLECAHSAQVDCIISGDRHLLELAKFEDIIIVKATDFLEILSKSVKRK